MPTGMEENKRAQHMLYPRGGHREWGRVEVRVLELELESIIWMASVTFTVITVPQAPAYER